MNKILIVIAIGLIAGGVYVARNLHMESKYEGRQSINDGEVINMDKEKTDITSLKPDELLIGEYVVKVEIADTPTERTKGLSGKTNLEEGKGMLFIFDEKLVPSFWMKDMRFSIDIVWIDENGKIVGYEEGVSPESYPQTFSPQSEVKFVLEVPAVWIASHNVEVGETVYGSVIK